MADTINNNNDKIMELVKELVGNNTALGKDINDKIKGIFTTLSSTLNTQIKGIKIDKNLSINDLFELSDKDIEDNKKKYKENIKNIIDSIDKIDTNSSKGDAKQLITYGLSLDSLFSVPAGMAPLSRKKIDTLRNSILGKISKIDGNIKFKDFDLNTLFGYSGMSKFDQLNPWSKFNNTRKAILDKIQNNVPEIKFKDFDLTSLFGYANQKMNKETSTNFNRIRNSILNNISQNINSNTLKFEKFNLGSLFISNPKTDILSNFRYNLMFNDLRTKILKRVGALVSDKKLAFEDFNIGDLFIGQQPMNFYHAYRFNKIKTMILDEINDLVSGGLLDFKDFEIGTLFNETPEMGKTAQTTFNTIRNKILGNINALINSNSLNFKDFDLGLLFSQTPEMNENTSKLFSRARNKIIKQLNDITETIDVKSLDVTSLLMSGAPSIGRKYRAKLERVLEDLIDKISTTGVESSSIPNKPSNDFVSRGGGKPQHFSKDDNLIGFKGKLADVIGLDKLQKQSRAETVFEDKPQKVIITDFDKEAISDLQKIQPKKMADKKDEKKDKSFLDELLSGKLAPVFKGGLVLLGGVASLITGLMTTGPLKGSLEVLGKLGVGGGLKMLTKTFAKKFALKALKRLPVIGGLVSFGYAISRFMSGDWLGGIIDIASGAANFIPIAGPFLSMGIDVLQAMMDVKAGGSDKKAGAKKVDFVADFANKFLRKIPFIGNLIDWSQGMGQLFGGDFSIDTFKKIASMIPGVPTIIWMLENTGMDKKIENVATSGFKKGKELFNLFLKKFKVVENLSKFGEGWGQLFGGDFSKDTWEKISIYMPAIKPFMWMADKASEMGTEIGNTGAPNASFVSKFAEWSKIKALSLLKKLPYWIRKTLSFHPLMPKGIMDDDDESIPNISNPNSKKTNMVPVEPEKANDFIWRSGRPVQRFSAADNVIGFKDKLNIQLKDGELINKNINLLNETMKNVQKSIVELTNVTQIGFKSSVKSANITAPMTPVPEPKMRETSYDKAHEFRTDAWKILRGVS